MGLASYEIVGNPGEWRVRHDGKAENIYETKESAFEGCCGCGVVSASPRARGAGISAGSGDCYRGSERWIGQADSGQKGGG
jgi:hypothetical protein